MTKIAIWCRHLENNIIGIGPNIPWHISSDFQRFKRITTNQSIVVGQTTYESFPNRTLPNRKIYVLTFDKNYKVSDPNNHFIVHHLDDLNKIDEPLYICGGASIYNLFMRENLVDIVIDSAYHGPIQENLSGKPVDITDCINQLKYNFKQTGPTQSLDLVDTSVWINKNSQANFEVINHIQSAIFQN